MKEKCQNMSNICNINPTEQNPYKQKYSFIYGKETTNNIINERRKQPLKFQWRGNNQQYYYLFYKESDA